MTAAMLYRGIEELAQVNDMNYEEALAELRYNYDGYHFSGKGADMYRFVVVDSRA